MNITVRKNEIAKASVESTVSAENFASDLKKYLMTIESITTIWSGHFATQTINNMQEKYTSTLNELADTLKDYAEYLGKVPGAYSLLDENFASKHIDV